MTEDRVPTQSLDDTLRAWGLNPADFIESLTGWGYEIRPVASAQPAPPLTRTMVQNAVDEAWLESHDSRDIPRPPDLGEHLYEALADYAAIERSAQPAPPLDVRRQVVEQIRREFRRPENMLTSFKAYTPDEPRGFIKAYVAEAVDRILDEVARDD